MTLVARPHPPALPHGAIREVLPDVFFVQGTIPLPGALPVRFSRNMTIAREGERLVLVNSVRLDDAGLAALDKLGKVTDVIRLAGNHGMDDPFYREHYGAKVWVVAGQRYTSGFDTKSPDVYLEPDVEMDATTKLPLEGARLYPIASRPPEGLLLLERSKTLIAGDCFQHWAKSDEYFSFLAKLLMPLMGFIKPHNIGPAWFKQCKPPTSDIRGILALDFVNVLPGHGGEVIGNAKELYRPVIDRVTGR